MLTDRKYIVPRKWSNRELRKLATVFTGDVVNVSGWDDRDKEGGKYEAYFKNASTYSRTNYSGHRGYEGAPGEIPLDLVGDVPAELKRRFDVVYNHTTLEHIFEVNKAFANLCELSKDVVIVVVPFSQVQHESKSYGDFWRFTPTCLRQMFRQNGFEVIYESESPHRRAAIYLLFIAARDPQRWANKLPRYKPVKIAGKWIGASLLVSGWQFTTHNVGKLVEQRRARKSG